MRPRFDAEKNIYYEDDTMLEGWSGLSAKKNGVDFIPVIRLSSRIVLPENFRGISEPEKEKVLTRQHWLNWCDKIPRDVLKMTAPFKEGQWLVLVCLQKTGRPGIELCSSNKGLFFALAVSRLYIKAADENSIKFIEKYINMPRRDIAGILGFPSSEQSVKILGKIKASQCSYELIYALQDVMRSDEKRHCLSHLPVINRAVVSLMQAEFERYTAPSLFFSIANNISKLGAVAERLHKMLKDIIDLRADFFERRKDFRFKSYEQITQMHLALEEFWGSANRRKRNIRLPEPPFKMVSDQIVPITLKSELFEESQEMCNCVRTYLKEILMGEAFFYKVLDPRLIFLIRKNEDGLWQLVDIRGFANCRIDDNIKLEITELVDEANKGPLDLSFLKDTAVFEILPGKEESDLRKDEIPF